MICTHKVNPALTIYDHVRVAWLSPHAPEGPVVNGQLLSPQNMGHIQ
ncbi:hypothetical protein CCUG62472_00632 [Mycobacteroides salmoniphilum]|nr:hypothetical protein CCUG62472_00632 [Mycobacteroides salmoniphilum]